MALLVGVCGVSCAPVAGDGGESGDVTDEVADTEVAQEFEFEAVPVVLPTVEELEQAISAFMVEIPGLTSDEVFELRTHQASYETSQCPQWEVFNTAKSWSQPGAGCENADGSRFQGKMQIPVDLEGMADVEVKALLDYWLPVYRPGLTANWNTRVVDGRSLQAEMIIHDPEGFRWELSGEFTRMKVKYEDILVFSHTLDGDQVYDGVIEEDNAWSTRGWRPALTLIDITPETESLHHRQLYGAIAGLQGVVSAFEFNEFVLAHEALGSSCELEPSGVIRVRDAAGHWIDVSFDGSSLPGEIVADELCDGCGEAYYGDEALGTVCVDFLPMLADEVVVP